MFNHVENQLESPLKDPLLLICLSSHCRLVPSGLNHDEAQWYARTVDKEETWLELILIRVVILCGWVALLVHLPISR